jgi:phosphoglycerate dehydrogenase-like enzyme
MPEPVVMLEAIAQERVDRITPLLPPQFTLDVAEGDTPEDRLAAICRGRFAISGHGRVTAEMIRAGKAAGLIAIHKWGVGYDNIDIEAARAEGVRVLRTTGSNAVPVAETTLGLILALQRSIFLGHAAVNAGEWSTAALGARTFMLAGRTVGLVGFGPIGQHVARLLGAFGCRVLYAKRTPLAPEAEAASGATHAPLETLLAEADILSLHCPLTPQTKGLIDAAALARMKPGALLVNTARGGVCDEAAVAAAIRSGQLRGAGFDVFAQEPPAPDNPLIGLPNVIVMPHIAAQAFDNFAPTVRRMLDNFARLAAGEPPVPTDVVV